MILVTRFNGSEFYINADMIISVEGTPDTVITLTNNSKLVVKEKPDKVIEKIIAYQRIVHNPKIKTTSGD